MTRKRSFTTNAAQNYKDSLETKSALIESKKKHSKAKLQKRLTQRQKKKEAIESNSDDNNDDDEDDDDDKDMNKNIGKNNEEEDVKNWNVVIRSKTKEQQQKEKIIEKMANHSNAYVDFICPISMRVMKHPYFCKSDGFTYEKKKILRYIKRNTSNTTLSPMTNDVPIIEDDFIDNHALEQAILYWKSHSNNYIPSTKKKKSKKDDGSGVNSNKKKKKRKSGSKKRNRSFTQTMIKEWEKNNEQHVEKHLHGKRKKSQDRLKTRLFKRDQVVKVTPIEKAEEFFDKEKEMNEKAIEQEPKGDDIV